jgi:hypothetical protein
MTTQLRAMRAVQCEQEVGTRSRAVIWFKHARVYPNNHVIMSPGVSALGHRDAELLRSMRWSFQNKERVQFLPVTTCPSRS